MLGNGASDLRLALKFLSVLHAADGAENPRDVPVEMEQEIRFRFPGMNPILPYGASDIRPRMCIAMSNDDSLLIVHGTDLETQWLPQITGFIPALGDTGAQNFNFPTSTWVNESAGAIPAFLESINFWSRPHVWVVGHSAGMGVSHNILDLKLQTNRGHTTSVYHGVSFGGNNFTNRQMAARLDLCDCVRYFNEEDPIPALPWSILRIGAYAAILDEYRARRVLNFVPFGAGIALPAAGDMYSAPYPAPAAIDAGLSLATFLRTFQVGQWGPHQLGVYEQRIQYQLDRNITRANLVPTVPPEDVPLPLQIPSPMTANEAKAFLAMVGKQAVEARDDAAVNRGTVLADHRFKIRKKNGIWMVVRDGVPVAPCPSKRAARKLAKQLNGILTSRANPGEMADALRLIQ